MGESELLSPTDLEVGRLFFERGDCKEAMIHLKAAARHFYQINEKLYYLDSCNLLLRVAAELEDQSTIKAITAELHGRVARNEIEMTGKTFYSLGLCASYSGQDQEALSHMEKAMELSLAQGNKRDICYAVQGLALVYFKLGRYEQAAKEIQNLNVFLQVLDIPEIRISSIILEGYLLRVEKKYEDALQVFWRAYELLKQEKVLTLFISALYALGVTYVDIGDRDSARIYLDLAMRAIDPENMPWMNRRLEAALTRLCVEGADDYDLVFKPQSHALFERNKGKIDFRNQFVLLDMLKMFIKSPGQVHSKESMVAAVWKQQYDPAVHDNKIYVTIKRLRKMIEPEYEKPKYIFRAKNGYYLNKNAKILVET